MGREYVSARPQLAIREHLKIVLSHIGDLELRQTSRDCAEHLELVLPKLKMMYLGLSLTLNMALFIGSPQVWLPNIIWQRNAIVLNIKLLYYLIK